VKHIVIDTNMRCSSERYEFGKERPPGATILFVSDSHASAVVDAINAARAGLARIIETDNFGGDYPDESFLLYPMPREAAQRIADAINASVPDNHRRYWRVVDVDYQLQPGFEP
jgi:hypothetical protein